MTWQDYYDEVWDEPDPVADYSSSALRVQELGVMLGVCGGLAGARVLDAGCGTGGFAATAEELGAWVTGFDFAQPAVDYLNQRLRGTYGVADLADPATWPPGAFDVVTCVEALQYVDPQSTIHELWTRVAPGGRLIVTVPCVDSPINPTSVDGRPFAAMTEVGFDATLRNLPGARRIDVVGLHLAGDQSVAPLTSSGAGAPYRLMAVALRW